MCGAARIAVGLLCSECGARFEPRSINQVTCGKAPCKSRRDWSMQKRRPDVVARSRRRNAKWAAKNRGCRRPQPWLYGAPPYGKFLPGGVLSINVSPLPERQVMLRHAHALHGMLTGILKTQHDPSAPEFSLVPWGNRFGWSVCVFSCAAANRLSGQTVDAILFDKPVQVSLSVAWKMRAPAVAKRGKRRLLIDAVTPVVTRRTTDGGSVMYTAPTAATIVSSIDSWLWQVTGVDPRPGEATLALVDRDTEAASVNVGQKLRTVRGWTGRCVVETNAPAHWALKAAEVFGLGGRCAYGFGRIRVSEL